MSGRHYLDDVLLQLRKLRGLADRALEQVSDEDLLAVLDASSNSIAVIVKHLSGNMRSRWTDFLTTDGEKPDRMRDREFELDAGDTVESLRQRWTQGWELALGAISALAPEDLGKTVRIRGEPHTVLEAINRQLCHYAYHVGQIVFLARHLAGESWQSLSIPRGRSADFEVSKEGGTYRVEPDG